MQTQIEEIKMIMNDDDQLFIICNDSEGDNNEIKKKLTLLNICFQIIVFNKLYIDT